MNTMSYKGYTARMDFDAEDKIIVGRVLDIDDIITFHGTSVAQFEKALHAAVDSYIAACEKLGQAAEKPASGRLMLRVDPAVHAAAVKASARSGQSLNKWAEEVLFASGARLIGAQARTEWGKSPQRSLCFGISAQVVGTGGQQKHRSYSPDPATGSRRFGREE